MSTSSSQPDPAIVAILDSGRAGHRFRRRVAGLAVAVLLALGGAGYFLLGSHAGNSGPRYETETVARGNLVVTVSATGTLEPTNQVEVGSELSGLVEAVFVDDNDRVKAGQELARLDVSKLHDQIARSEAALASAEARVLQADATIKEARANLERLRVVSRLSGGKVPSQTELEAAEANQARANADAVAARAVVAEARAALSSDRTNLEKASIRSPIDGVVLARAVEPGQTVAASFQTPVLFSIAEDLTQMELQVAVDEADVGDVRDGQAATFGVDAWPSRRYPATITRVGFGSKTTDGVVSYRTILTVDNDDLSLRPGMTATAEIFTAKRDDVLLVPNGALRFEPPNEDATAPQSGGGIVASLIPRPPVQAVKKRSNVAAGNERAVWVLRDGAPVEVAVTVGVTDGRSTEIVGGGLEAGMQVITDLVAASE
jgi:HlyD family secretion protein